MEVYTENKKRYIEVHGIQYNVDNNHKRHRKLQEAPKQL